MAFPHFNFGEQPSSAKLNQIESEGNALIAATATTNWQPLTLQSNFVDSNPGTGYAPGYRLEGRMVQLRGTVVRTVGGGTGAGSIIFNLPAGFRPAAQVLMLIGSFDGASTYGQFRVNVASNGDLTNGVTYPSGMTLFLNGVNLPVG